MVINCVSSVFLRFSNLPPTVQPEYIAKKTIDAIERNENYIVLPWWLSPIFAMKPYVLFVLKLHLLSFHIFWHCLTVFLVI